jgi:nitroreductase
MDKNNQLKKLKKPDLQAQVIKEIESRFSPRVYSDEEVGESDIDSMFEAARWAPSARNRQPWFFYWTKKGTEAHKKMISCLPEYNEWTAKAPILILACYLDEDSEYALYDLGAAVISLIYQATSLGYYCRQVGSFDRKKAKKILNLPQSHEPFTLIPLGRLGDYSKAPPAILDMDFQKRERKTTLSQHRFW